ncbi:hypothetical protein PVK06_048772 [Gossypium arboreum]|uniref:Uncharacterized protein n=1 Tax=Gossypium arboreum TaxID=29729 RepID=A0ABR0MGV4_GOSAR|nr:hypothetical protein PVK06_048772 [Gossypium arboreum]
MLLRNDKPKGGTERLGSSASGAEANEAKENNKSMEYFLCGGLHSLQNWQKKFFVEGDNRSDRKPMRLGSIPKRVKTKRIELRGDEIRGKSFEGQDNPIVRLVNKELRCRESSEVNQVNVIPKAQRGNCKNGWGKMSRAAV